MGLLQHRGQDGGSQNQDEADRRQGQEVPLPAQPGEACLINNYLLHRSGPNLTPNHRRAATLCYKAADMPLLDRPGDSHVDFTRVPMS